MSILDFFFRPLLRRLGGEREPVDRVGPVARLLLPGELPVAVADPSGGQLLRGRRSWGGGGMVKVPVPRVKGQAASVVLLRSRRRPGLLLLRPER